MRWFCHSAIPCCARYCRPPLPHPSCDVRPHARFRGERVPAKPPALIPGRSFPERARLFRGNRRRPAQPVQQSPRREIDHDDLVGLLHHPVGNRLANPYARDMKNLIVQALQVLDVHRGQDADPSVQKQFHVFPTLCPDGAGNVGVREFVHEANLRRAGENRVGIHLLETRAAIVDDLARNDFEPFGFRDGIFAAVGLEITDHHVHALFPELLALFEHLVGLADTGGVAHEDLQFSARRFRHVYCGKTRTSMPSDRRMIFSTGLPHSRDQSPRCWLCPI